MMKTYNSLIAGLRPILTAAAATVLSACPNFNMSSPADRAVVPPSAQTTVTVQAAPSMSGLMVKVDGTDVTNQINYVSDVQSQGDLSLQPGTHSITAEADVPCWYCSNQMYHPTASSTVCVGVSVPNILTKIVHAKKDDKVWSKTSDTSIGVATDDGTLKARWNQLRIAGIGQSIGLIISTENNCLCMRSTDSSDGTPIGLAFCDPNDKTQQWEAVQGPANDGTFSFQNQGYGGNLPCLTEGPNNVLIQHSLNNPPTSDQLWKTFDVTNQIFTSPF